MLEHEFIPAERSDRPATLVVLHGLGDSMEGYRFLPEALRLPWMNFVLVNAPDDYYGGFSWYTLGGEEHAGIERSRALVIELLRELQRKGTAASDLFIFGFSQGCLITLEVASRYPDPLAGLVGISGYAHRPEALIAERSPVATRQRILLTHGLRDPLIPIDLVRPQVEQLREAEFDITWREFDKEHTIAGEAEMGLIRRFLSEGRSS